MSFYRLGEEQKNYDNSKGEGGNVYTLRTPKITLALLIICLVLSLIRSHFVSFAWEK